MLLDTNTFVDLNRGFELAELAFRKTLYGQKASIVSKFELIVGSRSKKEMTEIEKGLIKTGTIFLPITPQISMLAEELLKKFFHSNGVGIQDVLIAATAMLHDEELVTRNQKHFNFIPNLKLIKAY